MISFNFFQFSFHFESCFSFPEIFSTVLFTLKKNLYRRTKAFKSDCAA